MKYHKYKYLDGVSKCECGVIRWYEQGHIVYRKDDENETIHHIECDRKEKKAVQKLNSAQLHNDGDLLIAIILLKKYFIKNKELIKDEEVRAAIRIIESSLESNGYAIAV